MAGGRQEKFPLIPPQAFAAELHTYYYSPLSLHSWTIFSNLFPPPPFHFILLLYFV